MRTVPALQTAVENMPPKRSVIRGRLNNPRSVMFRDILGVDDLDRMTEDFNPK